MPTATVLAAPLPTWQERFYSRGFNRSAGRAAHLAGKAYMGVEAVSAPTIDPVRMTARATITTPTPDRSDDVVHPMGVLLDNYRRNSPVFYDHGFSGITLPIGKSDDGEGNLLLDVTEAGIDATTIFSQKLLDAIQVFGLIEEGIVKSTSIGFIPWDAVPRGENGLEIKVWELLEYSWVGIPDNPEAVRKVLDRGKLAGSAFCPAIDTWLKQHAAPVVKTGRGMETRKMADEKPVDDKPADDPKPEDTKADDVVDEPVDGEPGDTEAPLGAQMASAVMNGATTLIAGITSGMGPLEQPEMKEAFGKFNEAITGALGELQSAYSSVYGKDLAADDPEAEKEPVEKFLAAHAVKRSKLSAIAFKLSALKNSKGLPTALKSVVGAIEKDARDLAADARKAMPKPEDAAVAELAEVKSTIKGLVKKFEDILPASKS